MESHTKGHSEKIFQDKVVQELKKYKWEAPEFLDGNTHRVTVDDLIVHWRQELNRLNAEQLENVPLTDNEFAQVMQQVDQIANSYDAAKILAMEDSKGKIDGIYRDSKPGITRRQITLTIFKKAEVGGGDSSYKIAREVVSPSNSSKGENRFDLILLINGLPLINIEQKRGDKSLDFAFGQFKRYYEDGEYRHNFLAFSQMMVCMSDIETRYFATPKSAKEFNPSFVFHWADKDNRPVNDWKKIVQDFLMIPMAHQMVGDYLIIDEAIKPENRRHMLMRPYQVYALRAIELAALGKDNVDGIKHGGFIWHTTGSGKTITSFKTALFLSTRIGFDKVIFMVDRRELDSHTADSFKAYAAYEPVEVDGTEYTYNLKTSIKNGRHGIIVTTTYKMANLVKELTDGQDISLKNKKFVFIIDEAHRTTMGDMMHLIKAYFKDNSLFYGFTGTPLFEENKANGRINEQSELINTTEKLFGPLLHQYTINEAISDGNVLGFNVDYINTGEFTSYQALKSQIIESYGVQHPEEHKEGIKKKFGSLNEGQIELAAKQMDILNYNNPEHIERVVARILDDWNHISGNKFFNAILTVGLKKRVIDYYREFKRQITERELNFNLAMTFSKGDENDPTSIDKDIYAEMFKDYETYTGVYFDVNDAKMGIDAYFQDLITRAAQGGSAQNPHNIDLVIVADQMLTGYDSKFLNALYVDRNLELQGLIQAYSRTNRVYGKDKEFGSIINFQYPRISEERVHEALALYSSGGENLQAIVDDYDTAVVKFSDAVARMQSEFPNPADWKLYEYDEEHKATVKKVYRAAASQLNKVKQYYAFEWDDETFGISLLEWQNYSGAYKNLFPTVDAGDDVINPMQGEVKLEGTELITATTIINLIGQRAYTKGSTQSVDAETLRLLHEKIAQLEIRGEAKTASLLLQFVDEELAEGKIPADKNVEQAFIEWKERKLMKKIKEYAEPRGLDINVLLDVFRRYNPNDAIIPNFDDLLASVQLEDNSKLLKVKMEITNSLRKQLTDWKLEALE